MRRKRKQYIVLIVLLSAFNLYLVFSAGSLKSSSFDDHLFAIADTSAINSVKIEYEGRKIQMNKGAKDWMLNNEYLVDENFRDILFSILHQVRVKRKTGKMEDEASGSLTLTFTNGDEKSFHFLSDQIGTKSFFLKNGIAYQVEVPGYRDNVVNIFSLKEDQWRNRLVFDGSWRTIQNLQLSFENKELEIKFNNQFFEVGGVVSIDSSSVIGYLNQFQYFEANEMISMGEFPELDSLRTTDPLAILKIDDIKYSSEAVFSIFPNLGDQAYHLVTKEDEMMVFDNFRIKSILKSNEDFMTD